MFSELRPLRDHLVPFVHSGFYMKDFLLCNYSLWLFVPIVFNEPAQFANKQKWGDFWNNIQYWILFLTYTLLHFMGLFHTLSLSCSEDRTAEHGYIQTWDHYYLTVQLSGCALLQSDCKVARATKAPRTVQDVLSGFLFLPTPPPISKAAFHSANQNPK